MPPTLENPFTPKSALPTKRLFGGEKKVVKKKLDKETRKRIKEKTKEQKEQFEKIEYGDHEILKPQARFLYKVGKEYIELVKEHQLLSEEKMIQMLTRRIEVDESGNIVKINFSDLGLKTLPSLDELTNLYTFLCRHNDLTSLPSLDKLTNLKWLDCSYNKLNYLPGLEKLANLKEFRCDDNKLANLPSLDKLTSLKDLYCHENNLTSLPSLDKLTNLKRIGCAKNKFSEQEKANIKSQVSKDCKLYF